MLTPSPSLISGGTESGRELDVLVLASSLLEVSELPHAESRRQVVDDSANL